MSIAPKDSLYRELRAAIAAEAVELPTAYEFVAQHWQFLLDEKEQAEREGRRLAWSKIVAILVSTKRIAEPVSGRTFGDYVFKAKEKSRKRAEEAVKVDREAHLEAQVEAQQEAMAQIATVLSSEARDEGGTESAVVALANGNPAMGGLLEKALNGYYQKQASRAAANSDQNWPVPEDYAENDEYLSNIKQLQRWTKDPKRFKGVAGSMKPYYAGFWDAYLEFAGERMDPFAKKTLSKVFDGVPRETSPKAVVQPAPAASAKPVDLVPGDIEPKANKTGGLRNLVSAVASASVKPQAPAVVFAQITSTDDLDDEDEVGADEDAVEEAVVPEADEASEIDVEAAPAPGIYEEGADEAVPVEFLEEAARQEAMPAAIRADAISEPVPAEAKAGKAEGGKPRRLAKLM